MISVSPQMQMLLSNPDGLTPVVDCSISTGNSLMAELTTTAQMQGLNDPALGVADIHIDAQRVNGTMMLAKGAYHAAVAAPTVYGQPHTMIYSVDVTRSWYTTVLDTAVATVTNTTKKIVDTTVNTVQKVANTVGNTVASWFGW